MRFVHGRPDANELQFLESFAGKQISSSEDRLEETKRRKLAIKARKLVELMMVSGIGTSSGFEERIRFSEIEIVDSNAIDTGVMHTLPEGNYINGWDVNVAGVRVTQVKHTIRKHKHAEFILRIKKKGELEHYVGRRYSDFAKLHSRLRQELPGRVVPEMPKKNKSDTTTTIAFTSMFSNGNESDASSISSVSTRPNGYSSMLTPGATHPISVGFLTYANFMKVTVGLGLRHHSDRIDPRGLIPLEFHLLVCPLREEDLALPSARIRISQINQRYG